MEKGRTWVANAGDVTKFEMCFLGPGESDENICLL